MRVCLYGFLCCCVFLFWGFICMGFYAGLAVKLFCIVFYLSMRVSNSSWQFVQPYHEATWQHIFVILNLIWGAFLSTQLCVFLIFITVFVKFIMAALVINILPFFGIKIWIFVSFNMHTVYFFEFTNTLLCGYWTIWLWSGVLNFALLLPCCTFSFGLLEADFA